ncbi:UNVERIFIED_CONTAM: hypothetical protein FKN15_020860 [Acipenser sinensis]
MEDCSLPLGRLGEKALRRLSEMLDNPTCGWRRLATAVSEVPRLCSRVEVQPQSQSSFEGGVVTLMCQASGPPGLGYQWFKGKEEVLHGTSSELVLSPLRPEHQGHYICRIHLGEQFVFSQWAQVRVSRSSSLSSVSGLFPSAVSRLQILSQPRPLALGEGDPLSLECVAEGNPPPQYQWYRNKQPLPQAHRACLQISCVTTVDRGQYSCRVYNSYQELWSKQVHVEIDSPQAQPSAPTRQLSPFYVVALMEPIRVEVQPQSQSSFEGGVVSLMCQASGPPGLGYQWFKGKEEVLHGTSSELVLSPLRPEHQGHYICRIHLGEQFVFSQWAQVRVSRSSSLSSVSGLFPSAVSRLQILSQPRPLALGEGDPLSLECVAEGNPPPQYQWYRNKQPLPQAHRACLQISCVTTVDRGQYSCRVYNSYQELWSKQVHVEIGPGSFTGLPWEEANQDSPQAQPSAPTRQLSPFYATDKVALLMGNMNYKFHRQLRAPMADVHELANLLRLLYYAGHGYENYGNSFMVPIDAPASYTSEHCLWVQDILQRMQERRTGLNVFLLDMCRKRNMNDDIIPQPGALKVTANIVFGYATCVDAEAYEVNKGCLSNGIFMSFLKERLLEDEKVTVLLDKVAEGALKVTANIVFGYATCVDAEAYEVNKGCLSNGIFMSFLKERLLEDEKVTVLLDKVAEVLPECRHLCFDCGVRVQLGFAAEFSNIMIIYTRILEKPSEIVHCVTRLIDFPEDLDVDLKITNRPLPEDTGSLLFTVDSFQFPESSCLYTRLSALQRLKRELKFSLCLQYQYCHMDEFVEEVQTVNVGKPLVAKLNLHESTPPPCSPAFDLRSLSFTGEPCSSLLQSSSFTECLAEGGSLTSLGTSGASSLGSASTCWSYYSNPGELLDPASPRRVNLPEETVSPEVLDLEAPRPLSENPQGFTSSMPYTGLGDVPFQFRSKQNFNSF